MSRMIPKTHETLERSVSQEYARLYLKTHRSITLERRVRINGISMSQR